MAKAIITRGKGTKSKEFKFSLYGDNGEPLCNGSEHYTRVHNARKTLSRYFPNFEIIERWKVVKLLD